MNGMREVARLLPGTQVVLRSGVRIPVESGYPRRKPGFIGEVVQLIDDVDESYVIRFSDGFVATLPRRALVVRRTLMTAELDMLAPEQINWHEYIVLRVRVGPKAYGLDEQETDDAVRSIYLPPAELHWSLYKPPEQIETQRPSGQVPPFGNGAGMTEEICWEIEKFVRQGLAAYPSVLEVMWTPVIIEASEVGRALLDIREAFLSKQIYGTFTGYAMSQFRKMGRARERGEDPRARHATQLIRLLLAGISAARTGDLNLLAHEHQTELLAIRSGRMSFDETYAWAITLQRQFEAALVSTSLPDLPDYETVNTFLVQARAEAVIQVAAR